MAGDGRIVSPATWTVWGGKTRSLEEGVGGEECVDGVLLPGLVNAHAHLDLSSAGSLPAEGTFPDWLARVGQARQVGRDLEGSAHHEVASLVQRGVVSLGDIDASGGRTTQVRRRSGMAGVSYLEVVGVADRVARRRLEHALEWFEQLAGPQRDVGISPHAPYSVHQDVLEEIARAAGRRKIPLAMHLAESVEETRFLLHGDGPFLGFLEKLGHGLPFSRVPGMRPIQYAEKLGLLKAGCLVVHGNDLDREDLDLLARRGSSVVYCHGTHQHFERPPHRLHELTEVGINLALGTDSAASNQEVDLVGEIGRLLQDRPEVDPLCILQAATSGGLRALGFDPGPADFQAGSPAHGMLVGPAPDDCEAMSAEDLVHWAFSAQVDILETFLHGEKAAKMKPLQSLQRAALVP